MQDGPILDTTTVLIFLFALLLGYFIVRKKRKLPPGPLSLPIIGNILQLGKHKEDLLKYFQHLGNKYGGLFSIRIGYIQALVITDYELIKQALVKQADAFSGRPQYMPFCTDTNGAEGM